MKKILAVTVFLFAILAPDTFGQAMLNVNKYFQLFSIERKEDIVNSDYVWEAEPEDMARFGNLAGTILPDTPLEFALLSYFSPAVIQIRPEQANTILPANNPRLAEQKLGAAVFQEIQVLRFLGDTAAVNRHEAVLQFITARGNATRAEVEAFYRNGIRGLVSEIVDEEFNKISFRLDWYNATLTRNPQNGQYILSYKDVNDVVKELPFASLEVLSSAMQNRGDFTRADESTVRAQAALIPAVAQSASVRNDIINVITAFYLDPNTSTANALNERHESLWRPKTDRAWAVANSFIGTLRALNPELVRQLFPLF